MSQKNVEEQVAALNIQVGNLCQFLPQVWENTNGRGEILGEYFGFMPQKT